jgi:ABC-type bacteriocin/lantibiotic exporter with double-glycine peptidase domain
MAADLHGVESTLGRRHEAGYSLAELAQASQALGLTLDGVQVDSGNIPLTRPAIGYFRGPFGGHYAVLRPVGVTGTMVQVIDPPNVPRVMDYQRLLSDNSWTGRLLTPRDRRAWWSGRIAWFAAGVFLVSAIVGLVRHHRSRSKTGSPGLSVFVVHPHP